MPLTNLSYELDIIRMSNRVKVIVSLKELK
jgi:hypothetical protein